jgi:hypothetical protein
MSAEGLLLRLSYLVAFNSWSYPEHCWRPMREHRAIAHDLRHALKIERQLAAWAGAGEQSAAMNCQIGRAPMSV